MHSSECIHAITGPFYAQAAGLSMYVMLKKNQLYAPVLTVRLLFFVQCHFLQGGRTVSELSYLATQTSFYASSGEREK